MAGESVGRAGGDPTRPLMLAFALYLIVTGVHTPLVMFLSGLSIVQFQFLCWSRWRAQSLVNL